VPSPLKRFELSHERSKKGKKGKPLSKGKQPLCPISELRRERGKRGKRGAHFSFQSPEGTEKKGKNRLLGDSEGTK